MKKKTLARIVLFGFFLAIGGLIVLGFYLAYGYIVLVLLGIFSLSVILHWVSENEDI